MWMVFSKGGWDSYAIGGGSAISAVEALNGTMVVSNSGFGLTTNNFISEKSTFQENGHSKLKFGGLAARNAGLTLSEDLGSAFWLTDDPCNDVAMTVLPNAPTDPATGLPVPTIAVATNGGVSVIKDDGSVVDSAFNLGAKLVAFDTDYGLYYSRNTTTGILGYASLTDYLSGDGFGDEVARTSIGTHSFDLGVYGYSELLNTADNIAITGNQSLYYGLGLYKPDTSDFTKTASVRITSDYNTGWMNGDIKLAALSDTDDTDVVGSELVTSGDFTGWTTRGGGGFTVNADGTLSISDGDHVSSGWVDSPSFSTVGGKKYIVRIESSSATGSGVGIYHNSGNGPNDYIFSRTHTFTAIGGTTTLNLYRYKDHNGSGTLTSISCRLADQDRSVNGNSLQIHGTIDKDPVATGAELVGYSGFSSSNYLEQPYNSDLNFGTGDFSVMGWFKSTGGANHGLIFRDYSFNTTTGIGLYLSNGYIVMQVAGSAIVTDGKQYNDGSWHQISLVRRSGQVYVYLDGKEIFSVNRPNTVNNGSATLRVGIRHDGNPFSGSMALWRISATAPTAEQIAKIYEDEKPLFQENAKATLYGTSDAVTALAHDDDTNLLHVGTSSGRSVFQGLRRVDNTTDAVGTAISASNDLVVEE